MLRYVWTHCLVVWLLAPLASADVIIFVDGTRMEVQRYDVKDELVVVTTLSGELRSVPLSYINMEATKAANEPRGGSATHRTPVPSRPTAPAAPKQPPAQEQPEPEPRAPAVEPSTEPAASSPPPAPAPPPVPPPVWTDEEHKVSLVIPSSAWSVETQTASLDVAVLLDNRTTGARATLALVRQRMRNYKDFQEVVREIEGSLTSSSDYRPLSSGLLSLDPYTAHEIRYSKAVDGVGYYSRIVIYYSRDLAYVLSMICPENLLARNEMDFDALIRGLVIKKVRKEISPKGVPRS